jgi:hypothetical protein
LWKPVQLNPYFTLKYKLNLAVLYILYFDKICCRCQQKRIEALWLSRKPVQWKSQFTYSIPICTNYNYCPIWVNFRIRDLPTILPVFQSFVNIFAWKAAFFVCACMKLNLTRVPWEVAEFLRQTKPWKCLCNASRNAPFAVLSRERQLQSCHVIRKRHFKPRISVTLTRFWAF